MEAGFILPAPSELSPILIRPRESSIIAPLQKCLRIGGRSDAIKAHATLNVDFEFLEKYPLPVAMNMGPGSNAPDDFSIVGIIIQIQNIDIRISVIADKILVIEKAMAIRSVSIEFLPIPICALMPFSGRNVVDESFVSRRKIEHVENMALLRIGKRGRIRD